ncbi:MAG: protease complex subunit PrcB family protein [Gemmataceae bacterium]|nr:protease complex subunit PrcB family protein [Gemmataceae bacterium]
MLHTLSIMIALSLPMAEPVAKELFAKEGFYKEQSGKEQDFIGVLRFTAPKEGIVGFGRTNPYRLEFEGKNGFREVYIGGKPEALKEFIDKKVKITGKPVDLEVEGRVHKEIWPARIQLATDKPKELKPVESPKPISNFGGVFLAPAPIKDGKPTEAPKPIASAAGRVTGSGNEAIVRTEEEFKKAGGEEFLKNAAMLFKVEKIDPAKHMIVVIGIGPRPTGGYSVEVTGTEIKDGNLVIKWKENKPTGIVTQAFTNPAVSVLLPKFEGKIIFDPAIPAGKDTPRRGIDDLKKSDVIRD